MKSDPRMDLTLAWDDLRAPLKVGSSAPATNTTYGWLEFAHNADNYVFTHIQLPHAWYSGTVLRPHVHWVKTTSAAGEVEWKLEYRWIGIGETMDGSWTPLSSFTPSVSDADTAYHHAITPLGDISSAGKDISDMLILKLTRLGSSYTGANHYGAAAALLEFDIHYLINSFGSKLEFIKDRR